MADENESRSKEGGIPFQYDVTSPTGTTTDTTSQIAPMKDGESQKSKGRNDEPQSKSSTENKDIHGILSNRLTPDYKPASQGEHELMDPQHVTLRHELTVPMRSPKLRPSSLYRFKKARNDKKRNSFPN